jgi:hypothetical protein
MTVNRDPAEVERIAGEVGLTTDQVAAVLAAADRRDPAAGQAAVAPAATAAPGSAIAIPEAAAWAATGVALVAMFVFVSSTNGFSERPDGKAAALITGIVATAIAIRAAVVSRRTGFALGEQLALSVVALISPLIAWSLLWLLGLWPGGWVELPASPGGADTRYWDSGDDRTVAVALLFVFVTPLAIGIWALRRTGAGLALALALLAAHGVAAALAVIIGIPPLDAGAIAALAAAYTAALTAVGLRLEPVSRPWATAVHPFAVAGAFVLVGATAEAAGAAAGLLVGALLLVAGVLLTVALAHGIHLAAVIVGGAIWDFWLYDELELGPVAGLALTLVLGLGTVALAVSMWRGPGRGPQRRPAA